MLLIRYVCGIVLPIRDIAPVSRALGSRLDTNEKRLGLRLGNTVTDILFALVWTGCRTPRITVCVSVRHPVCPASPFPENGENSGRHSLAPALRTGTFDAFFCCNDTNSERLMDDIKGYGKGKSGMFPGVHFEIPADGVERAMMFYEVLF